MGEMKGFYFLLFGFYRISLLRNAGQLVFDPSKKYFPGNNFFVLRNAILLIIFGKEVLNGERRIGIIGCRRCAWGID
ncbi:MAG TPA: hypothetical protein VK945_00825 [Planococcus sp. (in: firmicutes)]|nr:hypothetical protein [Planococcus sp. (in: firmicutes)]